MSSVISVSSQAKHDESQKHKKHRSSENGHHHHHHREKSHHHSHKKEDKHKSSKLEHMKSFSNFSEQKDKLKDNVNEHGEKKKERSNDDGRAKDKNKTEVTINRNKTELTVDEGLKKEDGHPVNQINENNSCSVTKHDHGKENDINGKKIHDIKGIPNQIMQSDDSVKCKKLDSEKIIGNTVDAISNDNVKKDTVERMMCDKSVLSNGDKESMTLKESKDNSSKTKATDVTHRTKHHKHHHRERSGSKSTSSSDSKSHKHAHHRNESKLDISHHKKSSSDHSQKSSSEASQRPSSASQKSESRSKSEHIHKTVSKENSDLHQKEEKSSTKESQKSELAGRSESVSSSDKQRSHHRKKRIVNCGVQVNLRKKTDTKCIQVPDEKGAELVDKTADSQKLSEKKLQRIAYVQQSITNVQKTGKNTKLTPRTGLDSGSETKQQSPVQSIQEFSAESQDNKFWKTDTASIEQYKYKNLMHVEQYSNGGGLVLHSYQNEVDMLSDKEKVEFALEFMDFVYGEPKEGVANCVMGIVHGALRNMPDLLEHLAETYPNLTVKAGVLGKSDIETMTMEKYREQVHKSFAAGTFRCGPLLQVSIVGTAQEEVGDYFPEMLDMFESDPFLNLVMPWGELSSVRMASRNMSNDGPILWTRPGEQLIPTADMPKSPFKRKRLVLIRH